MSPDDTGTCLSGEKDLQRDSLDVEMTDEDVDIEGEGCVCVYVYVCEIDNNYIPLKSSTESHGEH
jgi:hypothetical protein